PALANVRLLDVLDAIVKGAGRSIKYSIEDDAVVFSARTGQESPPLYVRTFKVDPKTLLDGLHAVMGPGWSHGPADSQALRDYLARAGVDWGPGGNMGKSIFFNDRQGMIIVRATLQDLDIIEAAIPMLNSVPPQIDIKFKVVGVPQNDAKALGFDWYLGNILMTNGSTGPEAGSAPSSNRVPTTAKPPAAFPGNLNAGTTNEPGANAQLLTSRLRPGGSPPFSPLGILTDPQFRMVIKA